MKPKFAALILAVLFFLIAIALSARGPKPYYETSAGKEKWKHYSTQHGLQPKRADVILAGACIVRTVMDKLRQNSLTVSDRGLRHGLLAERFGS